MPQAAATRYTARMPPTPQPLGAAALPPRDAAFEALAEGDPFDVLVVGGGATGLGCALDAAARGHRTALVEARDFAAGTSSRSTKLVHGGVRYLRRMRLALVHEGLVERARLRANAPHLVRSLRFVVPAWRRRDRWLVAAGLRLYDLLGGARGFERSRTLDARGVADALPGIRREGLCGGVAYSDGQFDDAAMALSLAVTAAAHGALLVNRARAVGLEVVGGAVRGARVRCEETGRVVSVRARVVVNAAGTGVDAVRRLERPDAGAIVRPSRGTHVVLPRDVLPGGAALLVPRTDDGRVIFAIPWYGRVLVGTTDVPVERPVEDPAPTPDEIDFLLRHLGRCLERRVGRGDVLAAFAGLRPLVRGRAARTRDLSRTHRVLVSPGGLVTIAGGKWTTYRRMAEEAVDQAAWVGRLDAVPSPTRTLALRPAPAMPTVPDADAVRRAVRQTMARDVEDVLARRSRLLVLDARAALAVAPEVAQAMADELGRDAAWAQAQVARIAQAVRRMGIDPDGGARG